MVSNWPRVVVSEACELIVDCVNKTAPTVPFRTAYRMIRTTNIKNSIIDLSNCKYVEKEVYESWTRRAVPQKGDVLLTREAPLGEVGILRNEAGVFLGQRIMQYRANRSILEPAFLFYAFRSPELRSQFYAHSGAGSTVDHIRVPDCLKFRIPLPPLLEQRAIIRVLGALDDKIDLSRRINETLETMARTLFKSWFVDFEPVRAKSEGRAPAGMNMEIAMLFPKSFGESRLGVTPAGWRVGPLSDLQAPYRYSFVAGPFGSNLTRTHYVDAGVPVIRGSNLAEGFGWFRDEDFVFVSEAKADELSGNMAFPGDVVFTQRGTLGQVGLIPEDARYPRYVLSQSQMKLTCDTAKTPAEYVFLYFKQAHVIDFLVANGMQAGVPHINLSFLRELPILIPPSTILQEFKRQIDPLKQSITARNRENKMLAALRDALLPKLLSGEIRMREAEKAVNGAL